MIHALEQGPGVAILPNPEQHAVIHADIDQWQLVVAGPGTGKTQVAAQRLVHLMQQGLQPAQILVLSFSRSAVATLAGRLDCYRQEDKGALEDLRHLAIRTFDSWAFRMLRQGGASAQELLLRSYEENIALVTRKLLDDQDETLTRLANVRHVIVDEFQDLPGVRADLVTALLSRLNSVTGRRVGFTVLGDPVQAIYRFATRNDGEAVLRDPWLDLKLQMGGELKEITLSQNYRATVKLAKMASSLRKILGSGALDDERKLETIKKFLAGVPTSSAEEKLSPDWLTDQSEGSTAILTRTNGEAMRIWKMLVGDSLEGPSSPLMLRLAGSAPYVPAWIATIFFGFKNPTISRKVFDIAYRKVVGELGPEVCREIELPPADIAWRRLARASGAPDTTDSIDLGELRDRLEWPDAFPDDQSARYAKTCITTIHQAKGMEFDNVCLLESKERKDAESPDDPLEEAHVGFVALTRAGQQLVRFPSVAIYDAPGSRSFKQGRSRQVYWGRTGKMANFQIGLAGDIDPVSFVDTVVHGDVAGVQASQDALLRHARDWRGHRVVLRQISARARDVRYEVRLQVPAGDGPVIGLTAAQVTYDLLDLLWKGGFSMPTLIYNLRIAEIVSVSVQGDLPESVPEPWRSSRLWLGAALIGTGDFKKWKRRGN